MEFDLGYYRGRRAKPGMSSRKAQLISELRMLNYELTHLIITDLEIGKSERRLSVDSKIEEHIKILESVLIKDNNV